MRERQREREKEEGEKVNRRESTNGEMETNITDREKDAQSWREEG